MVQLLYNRGVSEPAAVAPFLAADERLAGDPFLLPGMDHAVERVRQALARGEKIAVYGDFDADGITATVLLVQGLTQLGARVMPYIPHRREEGYGLNFTALRRLRDEGITLLITVDSGTSDIAEVDFARSLGQEIIITDHHAVSSSLPRAWAIINPKRPDSPYPCRELSGVGVAFKLLQALGAGLDVERSLDLVALGTVADMSPLLGENRYLVKRGVEVLNNTRRVGLQELVRHAGLSMGSLDAGSIAYMLAPRLNAAGRIDNAILSYDLLITESPEKADRLAEIIEEKNAERQRLTAEVLAKAKEKLPDPSLPLIMVGSDDYPSGVVGLVASRLVDEFYRPAIVLELGREVSRGSARSIPEFNIVNALAACRELLQRFGGHAQAAGFMVSNANLPILSERLLKMAQAQLAGVDLHPALTIDAEVSPTSLGGLFQLTRQLAPFGQGNPVPCFLSRGAKVKECRAVGDDGCHLLLKLQYGNVTWDAIGFGLGNMVDQVTSRLDIVYNLGVDDWRGTELLRIHLLDFAPPRPL
jgi:single-stranded-DNA-specific exonuclease